MIRLEVLDEPTGKGRPRFNPARGRPYTPTKTVNAEHAVRAAWDAAGRPTLRGGVPLRACVTCYLTRPANHFKKDGSISAAGARTPLPTKKPDVDNVAKLILDALEGYAYPSDVAIVSLSIDKVWTHSTPRTYVVVDEIVQAVA